MEEPSVLFRNINLKCPKCHIIYDHPYTCKYCRGNLCEKCIESPCFLCKKGDNKENDFAENVQFYRIIQSMTLICEYCEREMFSRKELIDHIYNKKCPIKIYICEVCKEHTIDLNKFWEHIKDKHKIELIKRFGV